MLGKNYIVEGCYTESIYLSKASATQRKFFETVFGHPLKLCFSEILFHPDLRIKTGREDSYWGWVDANIGSSLPILGWIARQQSFQTIK